MGIPIATIVNTLYLSSVNIRFYQQRNYVRAVLRYVPTQAFNFAFKDTTKQLMPQYEPAMDFGKFSLVQFASGSLGGALSLSIMYPLDYSRAHFAGDFNKKYNGLWDCMRKLVAEKGLRGLYAGFGISLTGILAYRAVYFGMYDSLREKNPYKDELGFKGILSKYALAQATAIAAGHVSYPLDTVRRRLLMQAERPMDQWVYTGAVDCFKKIIKQEGIRQLFKNAGANATRSLGAALVLVVYDQMQGMLAHINNKPSNSEKQWKERVYWVLC